MWSLDINIYLPIEEVYDYRLKLVVTRDTDIVPPEYDTADILLWQKDESKPEGSPVLTDYFTNVCSVADLVLRPTEAAAGAADTIYRKSELDMVFRSRSLFYDCLEAIETDIRQLSEAINNVNQVVTDPDYIT
jgi:hypothetical protein